MLRGIKVRKPSPTAQPPLSEKRIDVTPESYDDNDNIQREEWMLYPPKGEGLFTRREEKQVKIEPLKPKELNPHLNDKNYSPSPSTISSSWKERALKRAQERAKETGVPVNVILQEHWGNSFDSGQGTPPSNDRRKMVSLEGNLMRKPNSGDDNPLLPPSYYDKHRNQRPTEITSRLENIVSSDINMDYVSMSQEQLNDLAQQALEAESKGDTKTYNELSDQLKEIRKAKHLFKQKSKIEQLPTFDHNGKRIDGSLQGRKYFANQVDQSLSEMVLEAKEHSVQNFDAKLKLNITKDSGYHSNVRNNIEYDDQYGDQFINNNGVESFQIGDDKRINSEKKRKRLEEKQKSFIKQQQIKEFKKQKQAENCLFCFENKRFKNHLVIATGSKAYLTLPPYGRLVEGHCCIVPIQHSLSIHEVDEDVYEEIYLFKQALKKMFIEQEKDVLFLETVTPYSIKHEKHAFIECIPLPFHLMDKAAPYFKNAINDIGSTSYNLSASEWSQNKKLIDTRGKGIHRSVPKGFPYFHVEFELSGGFAHVIEDEKFSFTFGKEVVCGILKITPNEAKLKGGKFDEERNQVFSFVQQFSKFNWTKDTMHKEPQPKEGVAATSSRNGDGRTTSKENFNPQIQQPNPLSSSSNPSVTSNKPSLTTNSLSTTSTSIYKSRKPILTHIPTLDEIKQNPQPFAKIMEIYYQLDEKTTPCFEQKRMFIRLCLQILENKILVANEKDLHMLWMLFAVSLLTCNISNIENEMKELLSHQIKYFETNPHSITEDETFYILCAQYEWYSNEEKRDKVMKSLAKIEAGIKRIGKTVRLEEVKNSIFKHETFNFQITYRPEKFNSLITPNKSKTPPMDNIFGSNRRRRSNNENNQLRPGGRMNLFGNNSSINNINITGAPLGNSGLVTNTVSVPNSIVNNNATNGVTQNVISKPTVVSPTESTNNSNLNNVSATESQDNQLKRTREGDNGYKTTTTNTNDTKKRKPTVTVKIKQREYLVAAKIGIGGSCAVYKCVDVETNQEVAVKHIKIDKTDDETSVVKGFLDEAKLLERLKEDDINNNIIRLIDFEHRSHKTKEEILLVMELGSSDFSSIIKKQAKDKAPMPIDELRKYWKEMLEAVAFIHSKKIIHSDIKPSNFLLVNGKLKLIDFGISKTPDHENTQNIVRNSIIGTLNYMPPESFVVHQSITPTGENSGPKYKFGPPGDIWSLGIIFYQTIYNRTPFTDYTTHCTKINAITSESCIIPFPEIEGFSLAIDLLKKILVRDVSMRPSIPVILQHAFFQQGSNNHINPSVNLIPLNEMQTNFGFLENMKLTLHFLLSTLKVSDKEKSAHELLSFCYQFKESKLSEDDICNFFKDKFSQ